MVKVDVYNVNGEKSGNLELKDDVFGIKPKESVVHQVYIALMSNLRQPWAHVKDRSEVRGGGRKPWKQKGTGRARHGSIRSPLWVGGGVTFGPNANRNFKKKINKKMNRLAVRMCLSDKAKENQFVVLENLPADGKTKNAVALRRKLPGAGKTTLLLTEEKNEIILRAINNADKIDASRAQDVNVADLLRHQYVIATKKGVDILEKRLS
ncbi:MAG: 50S ribosomal protein L4 [Patescibacteria group bacterium]